MRVTIQELEHHSAELMCLIGGLKLLNDVVPRPGPGADPSEVCAWQALPAALDVVYTRAEELAHQIGEFSDRLDRGAVA